MSRTEDIPSHLHGECDECGSALNENGSNMTIISTSSGDTVTVRCDDCEDRHQNHMKELYEDYVGSKPLPLEHELDDAECHNCGEPWKDGDEWGERHISAPDSLGETWKYECPNCGHETFEVGT